MMAITNDHMAMRACRLSDWMRKCLYYEQQHKRTTKMHKYFQEYAPHQLSLKTDSFSGNKQTRFLSFSAKLFKLQEEEGLHFLRSRFLSPKAVTFRLLLCPWFFKEKPRRHFFVNQARKSKAKASPSSLFCSAFEWNHHQWPDL